MPQPTKPIPDGSTMDIAQMAEEIRAELRAMAKRQRLESREDMLRGLSRDEQVELIAAHLRFQGQRMTAPREWYL